MISALGKMNNAIGDKIMKKYILSIAAFALALSCTKENPVENELTLGEGIPVTVEVGAPENGNPDLVETKIIETAYGDTHKFQWEANDAFRLLFWKNETGDEHHTLYDAGVFTTETGGAQATFTGSIPVAEEGEYEEGEYKTWALYPASRIIPGSSKIDETSSAANKFSISKINLPAIQDGTGFKYCCFAAKDGVLKNEAGAWSFTKAPKFSMSNGIMHLKLNPELKVNKITVTCDYPGTASKLYLAGDITYVTSSTGDNSQGSEKTVTVYKDGDLLPEDVYIAVRHTVSNATYKVCHLKFAFYNTSGKVAFKTLKLAKYDKDGNVEKYVNIGSGNVYKIGNITSLNFKEPKTISWIGDTGKKEVTLEGPDGADYIGFPYANSSSSASVTHIFDGEKGALLAEASTYSVEKAYKVWTDKNKKEYNILTIGANTKKSGCFYYSPANIYQIRANYGYIIIPAIEGYRLNHVFAKFANKVDSNLFSICSDMASKTPTTIDDIKQKPVSKLTDADFELTSTQPNTAYYMYIDGDRTITEFTFTYVPVN